MGGNTTQWNLPFLTTGDTFDPNVWTALMASRFDAALTNAGIVKVADITAMAALTGMTEGYFADVAELDCLFRYDGTKWVQFTVAQVADTAARTTAYSKASGVYQVAGSARVYMLDRKYEVNYIDSTSGWKGRGGLVPIRPTAVTTGMSIAADGSIIYTAAPTNSRADGLFTSDFDNYKVIFKLSGSTAGSVIGIQFSQATVPDISANYLFEGMISTSSGGMVRWATSGAQYIDCGRLDPDAGRRSGGYFEIQGPAPAGEMTTFQWASFGVNSGAVAMQATGVMNLQKAFDGLNIINSGGTMTGKVQVFGYGRNI